MEVREEAVAGEYAKEVRNEEGRRKKEDGPRGQGPCAASRGRLHSSFFNLPPSDDAEALLWWKYRRTGKTCLRNEIVSLYQGWVISRARAFAYARGLDWAELWGAAAIALIQTIERFDPSCGVPFFAFAVRRVNGALHEALQRDSLRYAFGREARRRRNSAGDERDCRGGPLHPAVFRIEDGDGDDEGAAGPVHPVSREPDPSEAAAEEEIISRVLDSMGDGEKQPQMDADAEPYGKGDSDTRAVGVRLSSQAVPGRRLSAVSNAVSRPDPGGDGRLREIARRRFRLRESVDEISLALGLGRTRVNELLRDECLPRARRALRGMGLAPSTG